MRYALYTCCSTTLYILLADQSECGVHTNYLRHELGTAQYVVYRTTAVAVAKKPLQISDSFTLFFVSLRRHREPGERHGYPVLLLHWHLKHQDLGYQGHPGGVHLHGGVSACNRMYVTLASKRSLSPSNSYTTVPPMDACSTTPD